jgi:hypothetical protein
MVRLLGIYDSPYFSVLPGVLIDIRPINDLIESRSGDMQQFSDHLLEGLDFGGNLTDKEMNRMIRFVLTFEEEAFQLYMHLMTSTDNWKISAVFKQLADEKRLQVAQLIRLLGELNAAAKKLLH